MSLGFDNDAWDCHINHYFGYWWAELEDLGFHVYLSVLGWTETTWDDDGPAPTTEDMYWSDLTNEHKAAASEICYTREIWDGISIPEW